MMIITVSLIGDTGGNVELSRITLYFKDIAKF